MFMSIISIDFWGTLCYSNPEFKIKQFELVKEYDSEISIQDWMGKISTLKQYTDKMVESTGKQPHREELYRSIFPNWSTIRIDEFIKYSNDLFLEYPPIPTKLVELVNKWKLSGHRIHVSSNTVFIHGDVLSEVIYNYIGVVKSNCRFSDEVGKSKPDKSMFDFPILPNYHIGDNEVTDGACEEYGIHFLHVESFIDEHKTKLGELETLF